MLRCSNAWGAPLARVAQLGAVAGHGPHGIAVAQEGAGPRHDHLALAQAFAHLDEGTRRQPDLDLACRNAVGAHDLHGRPIGSIEDGGGGYRKPAAAGSLDAAAREGADPEAGVVAEEDAHPAEARRLV